MKLKACIVRGVGWSGFFVACSRCGFGVQQQQVVRGPFIEDWGLRRRYWIVDTYQREDI
jgi:hypothetical protein